MFASPFLCLDGMYEVKMKGLLVKQGLDATQPMVVACMQILLPFKPPVQSAFVVGATDADIERI